MIQIQINTVSFSWWLNIITLLLLSIQWQNILNVNVWSFITSELFYKKKKWMLVMTITKENVLLGNME